MGDWFDDITIVDEIAFDEGPLETPTTWYDITAYVQSFESFVGKTSLDSGFSPGYGRLVLDSPDRLFDPENAAGTYYGKLRPMRRYRRQVTVAAVTFTVFTGFVLSWDQDWRTKSSSVEIPLVDGTRFLENSPLPSSAYADEVLADDPIAYYPLQSGEQVIDVVGGYNGVFVAAGSTSDGTVVSVPGSVPIGEEDAVSSSSTTDTLSFLAPIGDIVPRTFEMWSDVSDNAFSFFALRSSDGLDLLEVYVYENEIGVDYLNAADNRTTFGDSYFGPRTASGRRHLVITTSATAIKWYENGVQTDQITLSAGSTAPGLSAFDGHIRFLIQDAGASHVAFYADELSASRIFTHYEAGLTAWGSSGHSEFGGARLTRVLDDMGFPAGLRDLDDGQTIHGPYRPGGVGSLDYIRQLETAEQGFVFFGPDGSVTFRDRASLWSGVDNAVVFSDAVDDLFLLDENDEPLLDEHGAPLRPAEGGGVEYVAGNPRGNPVDGVRNIVTASYNSVGGITRRDETSRTAYGEAREVLDAPTLPDGRAASNLAAFVLREKKDPKTVFPALEIDMRPDPDAQMPAVFGLTPGSIVTVRRTPMGVGAEIEKTAMVLGIAHRQDGRDANWRSSLYLAPALTQYDDGNYLRVGDALNDADPPVVPY